VRRLALYLVAALVVAAAAFFGWRALERAQRTARYDEWRKQLGDDARREAVMASLREELKEDPDLTDARCLLGEALAQAGRLSDATVQLETAVRRDPSNVQARRVLARVCLGQSRIDDAIKSLEEALAHAEGETRAQVELELGRAYQERYRGSAKDEDFRSARNRFQEARQSPALEAEALDGYAALWLEKGRNQDLGQAMDAWRELLKKHPDYSRAAEIREMVDHFDAASNGATDPAASGEQH